MRSAVVAAETSKCGFLQVLSEEMQLLFSSILKKMITVEKKSHTNIHFFFLREEMQLLFSSILKILKKMITVEKSDKEVPFFLLRGMQVLFSSILEIVMMAKPIQNLEAMIKIQEFQNYFFNV